MATQGPRQAGTALFREVFGTAPVLGASAPGRVNLLGEHTDYNGGPVLPIALDRRTVVHARPAHGFRFASALEPGVVERRMEEEPRGHWTDYLVGVVRELAATGVELQGADIVVASSVPAGAGLSSSAALTVSAAAALSTLAGKRLSPEALVEVAWRAETTYVGVRCGRMDQTISVFGRAGKALEFETATGVRRMVPFAGIVRMIDSGLRHALVAGEYEHRRIECEEALRRCRRLMPELTALADIPVKALPKIGRELPKTLARRVRHVVTETARVHEAVDALRRGRGKRFGELLYAGHESLRRDFESSCEEADVIVALAKNAGATGARLTGAGWGGVVIILAPERSADRVVAQIQDGFARQFGRTPQAWAAKAGGGARVER
jgi:galactokinase